MIDVNWLHALCCLGTLPTVHLGARSRQHQVETAPEVMQDGLLLGEAIRQEGYPHICYRGTIGGSLGHADSAAGRSQAVFVMNRVIDHIARAVDLDPADVRLRNFITREAVPFDVGLLYRNGKPMIYDSSGDIACRHKASAFPVGPIGCGNRLMRNVVKVSERLSDGYGRLSEP